MKVKIQIKSVFGIVLFELEKENNTIKDTLLEAIEKGADLCGADLCSADLRSANLRGADLRGADLCGADLRSANLCGADLCSADLRSANLRGADLCCADLRCANLRCADLRCADLRCANLCGADLRSANLRGADLRSANLRSANLPFMPINCPSDGDFVGWKKVDNALVKLLIPEDAKRCSANTYKCRCDKAKVLAITSLDGSENYESIVNTSYNPYVEYKVGEMVYPDKFDDDRWNECGNGIHFFINKQHAIDY